MDIFDSVLGNDIDAVKKYIADGNDLNVKDSDGHTMLHWAAFEGNKDILKLLLEAGAKIKAVDFRGSSVLHNAVLRFNNNRIVQLLIAFDASVNDIINNAGNTALHWAADSGYLRTVQILLEAGADTTILNKDGDKAIDLAIKYGHLEVVKLLETHAVEA